MLNRLLLASALLILVVAYPLDAQTTTCPPVDGARDPRVQAVDCVRFGERWAAQVNGFGPGQLVSIFVTSDGGLVSAADRSARVGGDGILRVEVDTRNWYGVELLPGGYIFFAKDFAGGKGSVRREFQVLSTTGDVAPVVRPSVIASPAPNASPTPGVASPTAGSTTSPSVILDPTEAATLISAPAGTATPTREPTRTATPRSTLPTPEVIPTVSPTPTATATPSPEPTITAQPGCDPSYPGVCIPSPPPELSCDEVEFRDFVVLPPDPHGFDTNKDGYGCPSESDE